VGHQALTHAVILPDWDVLSGTLNHHLRHMT
jgi:hypothetical protein